MAAETEAEESVDNEMVPLAFVKGDVGRGHKGGISQV